MGLGGCVDRAQGEDEVEKVCEDSGQRSEECGRFSPGNTREKCGEACPDRLRRERKRCEAYFEMSICLSRMSCDELLEYEAALDVPYSPVSEHPGFPCQAEVVTNLDECAYDGGDF